MNEQPDKIAIKLDRVVALALFEWAQRFTERKNPQFTHPADAVAVALIADELQRELPEVFTNAYSGLLHTGRERVMKEFLAETGLDWLDELSYQDTVAGTGT